MKTKKYTMSFVENSVDELTQSQFDALIRDSQNARETPEKYGNYMFIRDAVTEDGRFVWLGVKQLVPYQK